MAAYGRYTIPLWRVWDIENKTFIHGITGTKQHVSRRFHDWLCNNYCHGLNPRDPESLMTLPTPEDRAFLRKQYRDARKNYRLSQVQVQISDDFTTFKAPCLVAVVI